MREKLNKQNERERERATFDREKEAEIGKVLHAAAVSDYESASKRRGDDDDGVASMSS